MRAPKVDFAIPPLYTLFTLEGNDAREPANGGPGYPAHHRRPPARFANKLAGSGSGRAPVLKECQSKELLQVPVQLLLQASVKTKPIRRAIMVWYASL